MTVQRQGRRARPISRRSKSADGVTQTTKDTLAAFPDIRVIAPEKEPPHSRPPVTKEVNKKGAQNRLARAAMLQQSQ